MGDNMMTALRLYQPGDLRLEQLTTPVPAADEVVVKVHACGICGSDVARVMQLGAHVMPITPGHELSGTVVALGDNVHRVKVGDAVTVAPLIPCWECNYCLTGQFSLCDQYGYVGSRQDGAFADSMKVSERNVVPVPDAVSLDAAALTDPAANGLHALWRGQMRAGDTVLIVGMGAIGLFALQWAKLMGARLTMAVDIFDDKLQLAQALGADVVANSRTQDSDNVVRVVTHGQGFDVVVDLAALPATQRFAVRSAAKRGHVVIHGISHQGLTLTEEELDFLQRREIEFVGSWNSFSAPFPGREWMLALHFMAQGQIKAEPIISQRVSLAGLPDVFRLLATGTQNVNKVLCVPGGDTV